MPIISMSKHLQRALAIAILLTGLSSLSAIAESIGSLAKKYGTKIELSKTRFSIKHGKYKVEGESPSPEESKAAAAMLSEALPLYPNGFIKKARLRRIVAVRDLMVNGKRLGGWADIEKRTMYVNAGYILRAPDAVLQTFHHELFHIVDLGGYGGNRRDSQWERLNPRGFRYGTGGYAMLDDPRAGLLTDKYPGFLNRYSTSAVWEDKAEIFAYMVSNYSVMEHIAKNDTTILNKMQLMKEKLKKFWHEMGKSFWAQFQPKEAISPEALKRVQKLIKRAEKALEKGHLYEAYRGYRKALRLARRKLQGPEGAVLIRAMISQISTIYGNVSEPLDAAEAAIGRRAAGDALDALNRFMEKYKDFLDIVEMENRYNTLFQNPALRQEKRERLVRKRLTQGDAAMKRGQYVTAEKRYRSAATLFEGKTEAGALARKRLKALLSNPTIVKAMKKEVMDYKCRTLMARARFLTGEERFEDAAKVYDEILRTYPATDWAAQARKARDALPPRR
jgi:tetratricopeptide (TPR) repeat protein